ncbi:Putative N-acetyl-LL-diaminopimelate aminotransferase [Pirellula sp. SH-Sr6A]|nr:Putative N-acetyl-LL-diaminopimelate aminotransferase [Pirellula sp. SH-Sr6A]
MIPSSRTRETTQLFHFPSAENPIAMASTHPWIAKRTLAFDSSGIRKVFELAAKLTNPINLSIGQPDFDVPQPIRFSAIEAIESGRNAYSPTQGIPPLVDKLQKEIQKKWNHEDRKVFVSSGTSGGLVLSMLSLVDPGDEVIIFDPYFVMYVPLVQLVGGVPVLIDTYPDFRIDLDKVRDAITPRTKLVLFNSPGNPTGVTASVEEIEGLAKLCKEKNIALISDEIYSGFHFDSPMCSPAKFNEDTIVIDGFSKSHAMTGWRLGYVHGPSQVIQTMLKIQQYSFVCAPTPFQWAALAAYDHDMTQYYRDYASKRDRIVEGLKDDYEFTTPGGAFYIFPKAPGGSGSRFVERCIANELLVIPGNIFSQRDTHFRISFAASNETLDRGIDVLRKLARE